jgi:restriction endonuclease S subunit
VLLAKITPCFENGKGACLDILPTEYGFGSTEFHVLRARQCLRPQFLYRITTLPEFRRLGAEAMTGAAGQQRVPQEFVANFVCASPPLAEQSAIVCFLDDQTAKMDAAVRAARRQVALLHEYRTRLIADVVTGKLDVREAAARLPEEADEEPLAELETEDEANPGGLVEGEGVDQEGEE